MNWFEENDKKNIDELILSSQQRLINSMNSNGFWEGHLSSSAVSTAVGTFALYKYDFDSNKTKIFMGIDWLCDNINKDGGWGDTIDSKSNLSATLLSWSALSIVKDNPEYSDTLQKCEGWLIEWMGDLKPSTIINSIIKFYGNDKTFSVPILLFCTLAGRLGAEPECWKLIPQLPFELAVFPHQLYKWLNLNVVSYALPALIGIGLVKHQKSPSKFPVAKALRQKAILKVMNLLKGLQPSHGGFLEAAPLTGFVTMSLAATDYKDHIVTQKGAEFLKSNQRTDGSWPIDTNLATWVSTLAIKALDHGESYLNNGQKQTLTEWLLAQQFQNEHYFTHSAPGGWGWTHLPGGAPDADDTSGVLIALSKFYTGESNILKAVENGINWLLGLQNSDGGIPTFCRGWGKLPFDQSCPDLTAHALHAFIIWEDKLPHLKTQIDKSKNKMINYFIKTQKENGSWLPLWFGNQWNKNHENPVYGTSMVVLALQKMKIENSKVDLLLEKSFNWLISNQNVDHGWGNTNTGESNIEETSLALSALSGFGKSDAIYSGSKWLIEKMKNNVKLIACPIGLYFASLWYSEEMYPIVYSLSALQNIKKLNN